MNKVNWGKISNWLFYMGLVIGAFGYYNIFKVRAALPPGVCPVNDNRWLLFLAMFSMIGSVITATINERRKNIAE